MILIFLLCALPCLMAATAERTRAADLKQQVDVGITRHLAMSRALPNWLVDYETKRADLKNVMSNTTICTRRSWILGKIKYLNETYNKIKLAWDLKGEQLVILTQVLHNETYNNTGLKDFNNTGSNNEDGTECEQVLKSLGHYINLANETHIQEGNKTEIYKKELDEQYEWWITQPCDCIWTVWEPWTPCSKACKLEGENAGTTNRTRTKSQEALNDGACLGSSKESKTCNDVCCPVDCTWKPWSEWTQCEEKCPVSDNDGKISRHRGINEHRCGGKLCQGITEETQTCDIITIMKNTINGHENQISVQQNETTELRTKLCTLLNCQNGGVCDDGVCRCQPRYHGTSCEEYYSTPAGYDYKGCFLDSQYERMLREKSYLTQSDLTPETCKDLCAGYKYFGVANARDCYCGDDLKREEDKEELECDLACTGNSSIVCGGQSTLNLFERKLQPVCPEGYEFTSGDVPGRGESLHSVVYETDLISDCKDLCNSNHLCCSFEWSPTENKCHLNKECLPTKGWYKDYFFCHKPMPSGGISGLSLTTINWEGADSGNNLHLEICQGSSCCTTNKLPGHYGRGEKATWTESAVLDDCLGMVIDVNEDVQVTIDASEMGNGWNGQAISISTVNGQSTICPLDPNISFKNNIITSHQVTCSTGGISGLSLTTNDNPAASSKDNLHLKICQGSSCCNTNKLSGYYRSGETATWTESAVLYNCLGMRIDVNENVNATIDASELWNGWNGKALSISTVDGQSTYCPIPNISFKYNMKTSHQVTCIITGGISGLSLTTSNRTWAYSNDNLRLEICQGSSCCTTNKLPGLYPREQTVTWTESAVLSDCLGMRIDVNEKINARIDASELEDGWNGIAISISTVDGQSTSCPIDDSIDFRHDKTTSHQVTCIIAGNVIEKGHLLRTLESWGPDFGISLEFMLTQSIPGEFHNLLHLTIGGNNDKMGDRVPGVWFKSNRLHVAVKLTQNNANQAADSEALALNVWHHLSMKQEQVAEQKSKFTIILNHGEHTWTMDTYPTEFKNVLWYQSGNWDKSLEGKAEVRNVKYYSK